MSINGLGSASAAAAASSAQAPTPTAAASGPHKTLYGDPSRGEGLMNTMNIMKRLSASAQAVVSSRNSGLQ